MAENEKKGDDPTLSAAKELYREIEREANGGKFDIAKLGEAYEGLAIGVPLAGQYVEARRWLFAQADKLGIGRAIRVLYHGTETGTRVGASLSAAARVLASSNYGAASASTAGIASLIGLSAGPIGAAVAIGAAVLTFLGVDQMTPEEALVFAEAFQKNRQIARLLLARFEKSPAQKQIAQSVGFYAQVKRVAEMSDDPGSFIQDPELKALYVQRLLRKGSPISTSDLAILTGDVKERFAPFAKAWASGLLKGEKSTKGKTLSDLLKESASERTIRIAAREKTSYAAWAIGAGAVLGAGFLIKALKG